MGPDAHDPFYTNIQFPDEFVARSLQTISNVAAKNNCSKSVLIMCQNIQVRGSRRSDFLLPSRAVEKHGLVAARPNRVHLRVFPLTGIHSILQRALVEYVGGEETERGVHSVLNLLPDWTKRQ